MTIYYEPQENCRELSISDDWDHFFNPEVYGEFSEPKETPSGKVIYCERIINGLYLARTADRWFLAANAPLVETELSFAADRLNLGTQVGSYIFYTEKEMAVPVFELAEAFLSELDPYILSYDNLYVHLCMHFPEYVKEYNYMMLRTYDPAGICCVDKLIPHLNSVKDTYFEFPELTD